MRQRLKVALLAASAAVPTLAALMYFLVALLLRA
jgi:hypothetical protein